MTEVTLEQEVSMTEDQTKIKQETKRVLNRFGRKRGNLIPILQKVQGKLGYLPREAMLEIAEFLGIPEMDVYSVVTFYNQFRLNPPGKHSIRVCLGTACHVRGGPRVLEEIERDLNIKAGETTDDMEFTLETVNCIGACALRPIVAIDGEYYGNMTPAKINSLLKKHQRR